MNHMKRLPLRIALSALAFSIGVGFMPLPVGADDDVKPVALAEAPARKPAAKTWIRVSAKRCDFLVFTGAGQGFTGKFAGSSDAVVAGAPGAVISTDNNMPILHAGAIYIVSRKGTATITTRLVSVNVPQGVACQIESTPAAGTVRVAVLGGDSKSDVTTSSRKGRQFVSLHSGQEVSFSEGNRDAQPHPFDAASVAANPDLSSITPAGGAGVAVSEPPLHILGCDGTEFRYGGRDTLVLRTGEIFGQVPDKLIVRSAVGDAVATKGAIIDVDSDADVMRVRALSGPGHSSVAVGERTLTLNPGQELLVAAHDIGDSDLYPPDGVGRRRSDKVQIDGRLKGAICDFSIISFLNEAQHVQNIKHALAGDDKATLEKLLKTAAVVQTVGAAKYGPYRSVQRISRRRGSPGNQRQSGGSA